MTEESKTNSSEAKPATSKTTSTRATASKSGTTSKTTTAPKKESNEQALALSTQTKTLLPQNRPIEPSSLDIVNTYSSVGSNRPVVKGKVEFNSSLAISGNRPIAVSTLQVSDTYVVMGNRPVAPNESEETANLMGYLD